MYTYTYIYIYTCLAFSCKCLYCTNIEFLMWWAGDVEY